MSRWKNSQFQKVCLAPDGLFWHQINSRYNIFNTSKYMKRLMQFVRRWRKKKNINTHIQYGTTYNNWAVKIRPLACLSKAHLTVKQLSSRGFPGGSVVKNVLANAGNMGSIPGSGRSPGEGNGNPPQYSRLENPMDRGAWPAIVHGVTKELDATYLLNNNSW